MPSKRKKGSKPRAEKRLARKGDIVHIVEVGPRGLYWSIKFDTKHIGSVFLKQDAVDIAKLLQNLALCDGGVSLRVRNQLGKHSYEETLPRSADPTQSPG